MVAGLWRRCSPLVVTTVLLVSRVHAEPAQRTVVMLPPTPPPRSPAGSVGIFDRVPTVSWALGCAAGAALVAHALYQNVAERRRDRLGSCNEDCPGYRVAHYHESQERAEVALRLSVLAAASAFWLAYNDPSEAIDRMARRKGPRPRHGLKLKLKPERGGVWASVTAYF